MFNINNASITGNTGIKKLYKKNSNLHRFDYGSELVTGTIKKLEYYDRLDGDSNFIYRIKWNELVPHDTDTWLRINRAVRYL